MEILYTYPNDAIGLLQNSLTRYTYIDRPLLVEYLIREGSTLEWWQVEFLWYKSSGRKIDDLDLLDKEGIIRALGVVEYTQKPVVVVSCSYIFSEGSSPSEYMKVEKRDIERLILEMLDRDYEITYSTIDIFDKISCLYWYYNRNVFCGEITTPDQLTNIKFAEWYGISHPVYIPDIVDAFESPTYDSRWVVGDTIKYGTIDNWVTFDNIPIETSILTSSTYKYIPSYEHDKLTLVPLITDGIFNYRELYKLRTELVRVLSSGNQKYRKLSLLLSYIHEVIPYKAVAVPDNHTDIVRDVFLIMRDLGKLDILNEIEIRKAMLEIDILLVSMRRIHAYITLSVVLFDDTTMYDVLSYIRRVDIKKKVNIIRKTSSIIIDRYSL